ncbi:MAG: hypothetical protein LBS22_02245, partial [Puniceicoccales bacterium]|nr:hypothetical protein [Puniceicoccales bacterium]
LSFITRSEIQNMHEQIGEKHGIYEANRVLSYVCAIYKSPQSTAIYARLSNDPVRASMESALDFYRK